MKRILAAVLLLAVCASPAFARHKKPHKDRRFAEHPKAYHPKNEHLKHQVKHHVPKHNT